MNMDFSSDIVYELNVAEWFKSTFSQDGNGNINLAAPPFSEKRPFDYGIESIISNIDNKGYNAILDHIENACKYTNWVLSRQDWGVAGVFFYINISYVSARAELYMNSINDTKNLENFLKPVTKTAKMFSLKIPKVHFIKCLQTNNWYYRFRNSTNGCIGKPQELYLAWENEKLRKKVETLEHNLKLLTEKLENIEVNLRIEHLHTSSTNYKKKSYLAWENECLSKKVEELSEGGD